MDIHQWGFKSKIEWVMVEIAPLTASGLNEILIGGPTKKDVKAMAKALGFLLGKNSSVQIIKLSDAERKPDSNKEKPMLVGSPEHQQFEADECLKMALRDERDRMADELDRLEGRN